MKNRGHEIATTARLDNQQEKVKYELQYVYSKVSGASSDLGI